MQHERRHGYTLTECILLILGLKFSLSLLNVISSPLRNLFMPIRRDVGLGEEERVCTHYKDGSGSDDSRISTSGDRGCAFKHHHTIRQIGGHDKIMLHYKCCLFGM